MGAIARPELGLLLALLRLEPRVPTGSRLRLEPYGHTMLRKTALYAFGAVAPLILTGLWISQADCCLGKAAPMPSCCDGLDAVFAATTGDAVEPGESIEITTASFLPLGGSSLPQGPMGEAVVKGTIRFDGEAPARAKIKMEADKVCEGMHKEPLESEEWIVGKDRGLKNVFVYVKKGIEGKYDPPKDAFVLDQKGCQYIPHVFGVVAGQKITIKNSDATTHNVHSFGKKNTAINQAQPAGSKDLEVEWKNAETKVAIKCDMHPWMSTYCHIVKHPFFAITDDNGSFTIRNLPAGEYTIEAIHESLPSQTMDVKVGDKETREANFTFKK